MKPVIFVLLSFWVIGTLRSQTSKIAFYHGSFDSLMSVSKLEHKPVFLYFHFEGCGACKKMEKNVFAQQKVTEFVNENFNSFSIDIFKEQGDELRQVFNTQLYPSFIFLNSQGEVLHKIVGVFSPEDFIVEAKNALNSINTLSDYKNRYINGVRDAEFLFKFTYRLRDAGELTCEHVNEYLSKLSESQFLDEKNIRYIYEFALLQFNNCLSFESEAFRVLTNHKEQFYSVFEKEQVDCRILWLLESFAADAINEKDRNKLDFIIGIVNQLDEKPFYFFKEIDGRVTARIESNHFAQKHEIAFLEKLGNKRQYDKAVQKYISLIRDDWEALNAIAWSYYESKSNRTDLNKALSWAKHSIKLHNGYVNNDTLSALFFKLGKRRKGRKAAIIAIKLAKANNEDYSETLKMLKKYGVDTNTLQ